MSGLITSGDSGPPTSAKQRLLSRKNALWNERTAWMREWREISEYVLPRSGRYTTDDRNRGGKRNAHIYDNTGVFALRVASAGMLAGASSPARPWFRLGLRDKDMEKNASVKAWLHRTAQLLRDVFSSSNTYLALHMGYDEVVAFGTEATIILPSFENVIHCYPLTVGEYAIATDDEGKPNTIYREFSMTVAQMVQRFGKENCSQTVQNLYTQGKLDSWAPIIQAIEPRTDRTYGKSDPKNMPWKSCYFEPGGGSDKMLRESGFKNFPGVVARWVVTGSDTYGTSPGYDTLGDVKQLQHQQLRKSQGIDYLTNPPLQVPSNYKDAERARLPGGIFYVDSTGPNQGVKSAYDVRLDLSHLTADMEDVRSRVRQGFFYDLFLMLSSMEKNPQMTATEVAERHEEKLIMLGPVLERLHNEKLGPTIDIAFERCAAVGILPPAPPELEGEELKVEFVSVLAQAQRAVAAVSYDRLLGTVGQIAAVEPRVKHKINYFKAVDDYADMYGVNPELVRTDEEADERADAEAQAMAAAQAAQAAPGMATAAKAIGETDAANVQDVMSQFAGYTTPTT